MQSPCRWHPFTVHPAGPLCQLLVWLLGSLFMFYSQYGKFRPEPKLTLLSLVYCSAHPHPNTTQTSSKVLVMLFQTSCLSLYTPSLLTVLLLLFLHHQGNSALGPMPLNVLGSLYSHGGLKSVLQNISTMAPLATSFLKCTFLENHSIIPDHPI